VVSKSKGCAKRRLWRSRVTVMVLKSNAYVARHLVRMCELKGQASRLPFHRVGEQRLWFSRAMVFQMKSNGYVDSDTE
jgi:hypothetical protein